MKSNPEYGAASRHTGRGYMMQLLLHVVLAAVITSILEVFLVSNVSAFSRFLYQTGDDSPVVQRFALGSTTSVLLFVLFGIFLFSLVFFLLERRTARDIETIADAVEQISRGDLTTELSVEGEGELRNIAGSIMKMEQDIRTLIEKEHESEKQKTDLITNVAHDLRTPLTSILGYLELLRDRPELSPDVQRSYVDIAYTKSKRLQKLIEDLFGFTKLSYGKLNMKLTDVDIVRLIAQLLEESYPSFEKNGLSYEFIANTDTQLIRADGDLLARLFDNLITNAIKYGAEGKRVDVRLRADRTHVTVKVVNYGYAIPEKELPLIFEKFYRVEHSRNTATGGTGLGLAIVKNITDMHGGSVTVSSDLSGTVFTVRLPIAFSGETADPPATSDGRTEEQHV